MQPLVGHRDETKTAFHVPVEAFLSHQYHSVELRGPHFAIDGIIGPGNLLTVDSRDPYSFFSLDLGQNYSKLKVNGAIAYLRLNNGYQRFHDVEVTVGNIKPTDPLSKWVKAVELAWPMIACNSFSSI